MLTVVCDWAAISRGASAHGGKYGVGPAKWPKFMVKPTSKWLNKQCVGFGSYGRVDGADEVIRWLDKGVERALKATLAERTATTYNSASNQFLYFALWISKGDVFLPADDRLLCRYLVWQARTVAPENLSTYLSAVRNLHLSLGIPWVDLRDRYMVGWLVKGLRRLQGPKLRKKLPVTPELLVCMRKCPRINWEDPRMVVVWAVFLLAFFTISRKDNFTVEKVDAFNTRRHLTRGDVKVLVSSVQCTFRRSKVNQLGERVHKVLAMASPGAVLDPRVATVRALGVSPHARATDPAFMVPSAKGLVPLTHYVFVASLKYCLRAIGVDPDLYSGHSFRRGGATFAHRMGMDPMLIKRLGDWASEAYQGYIDPHTPEGLVSLPVAMARACAALG